MGYRCKQKGSLLYVSEAMMAGTGILTSHVPILMMFSHEDVETVEEDDEREVEQRDPCKVWLEVRFEHEGVPVHALGFERSVEPDIGDAD